MKLSSDFVGPKVIEKKSSKINGEVVVLKTLGLGTHIQVEGLTQSGSVVYDIWKTTLKKVSKDKKTVRKCLILGLGGGSAAKLAKRYWPNSKITGVEIDPVMIEMGKKHMGLKDLRVEITNTDASGYISQACKNCESYDLILIDMYVGYRIPEKFENIKFIRDIKKLLSTKGLAVFNRLYFDDKRKLARIFEKKLEENFADVDCIYPQANIMFICK